MMTLGRLRAIESYTSRQAGSASLLHARELILEVKRLREVLEVLKSHCGDQIGQAAKNDSPVLALLMDVHGLVAAALREPALGPPDLIHAPASS